MTDRKMAYHARRAAIRQEMDQHPVERGEHDNPMPLVSDLPSQRVRVLRSEAVPASRPNPYSPQAGTVAGGPATGEAGVESDDVRLRLPAEVNPREPMPWLRRR